MDLIKVKLAIMNFLQFAIWGSYLCSMGNYLGSHGLATNIGTFFGAQGIVSIFFPSIIGIIADRWIQAQLLYIICHIISAIAMFGVAMFGRAENPSFGSMYACFFVAIGFYMSTLSLSYAVAYNALEKRGYDTEKSFPPIRFFGTFGFIVTMNAVDFLGFQSNAGQFFVAAGLGIVLAIYAIFIPKCETRKDDNQSLTSRLGLDAFKLFGDKKMALFFIFSMCLGVALQITNSYANTYITSFKEIDKYKDTFGANHANALISLSQWSECFCILLIPFFLKRFGIKIVMLIAYIAWMLRFLLFGLGNPGLSGVWLFILSCIVYGVAFDFFNVSGSLFVNKETDEKMRASAQGLFMLMTNGIGSTIGTYGAQAIINKLVYDKSIENDKLAQLDGWRKSWYIFSAYAGVIAILFVVLFRYKHSEETQEEKKGEDIELKVEENN